MCPTCRLPYDVKSHGKTLGKKEDRYCLSLKDLSTLDIIPDIIDAGVYSMKIEGRMKSPRYTAGVVSIYRKYTDLYLTKGREGYQVEEEDRKILLDLFDRGGQTDGYYKRHNGREMVVWKEKPSFREGNSQLFESLDRDYVNKQLKEPVIGKAILTEGENTLFSLKAKVCHVEISGDLGMTAKNQPMSEEKVLKQLSKTGNTPFFFEKLKAEINGAVFLPVQSLNELRRRGLEELEEEILRGYKRQCKEPFVCCEQENNKKKGQASLLQLNASLERPDCFETVLN